MIGARYTPELIDGYLKKGYWNLTLMADAVDRNGKQYPDKEAVVDAESRLTWGEVSEKSDKLALGLRDLGFNRDDILLVQLPNCAEIYLLVVAGEKAGVTIVTAQPTFRHQEIGALLKHTEAKGIVIIRSFRDFSYYDMVRELRPQLPKLEHVIVTGKDVPEGTIALNDILEKKLRKKYPRDYILKNKFQPYEITRVVTTSGTTGIPKCAVWETCALMHAARIIARRWKLGPDDVIGAFYNIIGGGLSIFSLYGVPQVAAKLVLLERFTPEGFCELVQQEKITVAGIVPAEVARLLEYPDIDKYNLKSLRLLAHSTTLLPKELAFRAESKLGCKYVQTYGTMDCGPITCNAVNDPQEVRIATVGRPYDGNTVKIVDENGKEVPREKVGEVLISGPTLGTGYYRNPALNEQTWKEGWYDTTNEGFIDRDGNVVIMGRRRDIIKRGGQAIYPKEIEDMLVKHPRISQVAVVRMPDPIMGEKGCAFIVPRRGQTITFSEVIDFLKSLKLAPFKLPERVEVRDELPLVPAGNKVDVIRLEKEIAEILVKEERSRHTRG